MFRHSLQGLLFPLFLLFPHGLQLVPRLLQKEWVRSWGTDWCGALVEKTAQDRQKREVNGETGTQRDAWL